MTHRIRVRFAPSPTGSLHIGGLRTALYNYLFAKKHGGDFILRIEDTDQSRLVPGAVDQLLRTLKSFDLQPDEGPQIGAKGEVEEYGSFGPYVQSQRLSLYREHADKLIANGSAYYCFCTAERLEKLREIQQQKKLPTKYDGHCRNLTASEVQGCMAKNSPYVIRLRVPSSRTISLDDLVRKQVTFSTSLIDDQVLIKTDGYPTYHLANVVDDHLMQITDVIRGEEWLPSVPKHLLLYEAFGWTPPRMAHLPILLDANRAKLSKRKGALSCEEYMHQGILPEALLNFLLLLGWNPKTEKEIFNRTEMIAAFSLDQVHAAGAVVDEKKLAWMNEEYIRSSDPDTLIAYAILQGFIDASWQEKMRGSNWKQFIAHVTVRLKSLSQLRDDIAYFFSDPTPASDLLVEQSGPEKSQQILKEVLLLVESIDQWEMAHIKTTFEKMITDRAYKRGEVLWPIRVAISARKYSPGAYELMPLFSKNIIVRRLKNALDSIK